jgi:hypothetical protein
VFFRTGYGQFVRFDPDVHTGSEEVPLADDDEDVLTSLPTEEQTEFVVERQLEDFLVDNWERIDWGRPLTIWEGPDGTLGHEYPTENGRINMAGPQDTRAQRAAHRQAETARALASRFAISSGADG